ncbi:shuttle craft like transcriptional regulator [Schizosaccharomyces japonicus yFS275]|uniref:Shuttle craft like transcriptional regulator n=1 Tax=Schizosaccharomyces japonicus (strain yFS275 / FY16936) TaxID=402676 RepID=B6K130_SCHJY|nr:shuttle craft like transcriptional regulator [Schizosaccharomyces japonicus yFS275]EEB07651.1 shuttle craft like transcriptional regulator [Schizosaccharomyces japonicus yFS275]
MTEIESNVSTSVPKRNSERRRRGRRRGKSAKQANDVEVADNSSSQEANSNSATKLKEKNETKSSKVSKLSLLAPVFEPGKPFKASEGNGESSAKPVTDQKLANKKTDRRRGKPKSGKDEAVKKLSSEKNDGSTEAHNPSKKETQKKQRNRRKINISKLDLGSKITYEIKTGQYECLICTDSVKHRHPVWYCNTCFHVFHLKCITKWCTNSLQNMNERNWRCPACQTQQEETDLKYRCWCGKYEKPEYVRGSMPHSCSEPCGKKRGPQCEHRCPLLCHPGPCPPCSSVIEQFCLCGSESRMTRCGAKSGLSSEFRCENVCGELLPCGKHTCERVCHSGTCGQCDKMVTVTCFCGNESKKIACKNARSPAVCETITDDGSVKSWKGSYSCGAICKRRYNCGVHECGKPCHPEKADLGPCPLSPENVTHCPCRKNELKNIITKPRTSCSDPIPTCNEKCEKTLKCGHKCQSKCHLGPCLSCTAVVKTSCRCGFNEFEVPCESIQQGHEVTCERLCPVLRNCGRHQCNKKCCPGYPKAQKRLAKRPKGPRLTRYLMTEEFEEEHICVHTCGKTLSCGLHKCEHMCHRGPCPRCLQASFDELSCTCGRTKLYPPIPCGAKPPVCNYQCTLQKACGHPAVKHACHPTTEPCPSCVFLMEKLCLCRKTLVKNQPCWKENVFCGKVCGKLLPCGVHTCKKTCHPEGKCESSCTSICGRKKTYCEHHCSKPCHGRSPCNEFERCTELIEVSCKCGLRKEKVPCATCFDDPEPKHEVSCDDKCAIPERNRKLAEALNIDPDRAVRHLGEYNSDVVEFYAENKEFCEGVEQTLRSFCLSVRPLYSFPPMKTAFRRFIHQLSAIYCLQSESMDPEPRRSVVVHNRGISKVPSIPLSTALVYASKYPNVLQKAEVIQTTATPESDAIHYNALILLNVRDGVDEVELQKRLSDLSYVSDYKWSFHAVEQSYIMRPLNSDTIRNLLSLLISMRPLINRRLVIPGLIECCELCEVDSQDRLLRVHNRRPNTKHVANLRLQKEAPLSVTNRFDALEI